MNLNSTTSSALPGPDELFNYLAILFDTPVLNNQIIIPTEKGKGGLKKFHASNGLIVINWDMSLNQGFTFQRKATALYEGLSIIYVFTRKNVAVSATQEIEDPKQELKNIIIAPASTSLEFIIQPLKPARILEIIITAEWLEKEYAINSNLPYPFYTILMKQIEPGPFTEPASCTVYNLLSDIYKNSANEIPDSFYTRTKILSVLTDIFESLTNRNTPGYQDDLLMHGKMISIEELLEDHLDKTLPSMKLIAKQVGLSESTMKRNFKVLYGTSIYEYYLQQKMKKARALFDENPRTVKEVAYMLGYENVSNFIAMFKKHYHFLPGDLKRVTRL